MNALTRSFSAYWNSPIGKKLIVALTGLVLVLFLAGHMAGNLLVFAGREPFNDYAEFLHHAIHGAGIWLARGSLLVALVLHVVATIALTRQNRAARVPYEFPNTIQASKSSRIMIWTGLTILFFVIYHLMHFTAHIGNTYENYVDLQHLAKTGESRHDAWKMVIDGFHVWYVTLFYIIAMTVLCSHLGHGVASIFQTLGFNSKRSRPTIEKFSWIYTAVIWLGFVSIPVAILFRIVNY
ncbi:MAG: succinate dehydrogenase cytochrome b subunit [Verrucomicrobiaceae bacterium]|nr:MAG: succinate dehydrogenase cytochrome b subunit [Verrucomicrobiaceae bacterium]